MASRRNYSGELFISVSSLRLLESCHRSWYYKYMLGAPAEDVPARLVLGSAGHEALAFYYKALKDGLPEPSVETMVAIAADYITTAASAKVPLLLDDGQDVDDVIAEADRMLRAFAQKPYRPTKVLTVEEWFTTDIIHPTTGEVMTTEEKIGGVWDLVAEDGGGDEVLVIDHKFRRRAEPDGAADTQMAVYGLAAQLRFERGVRVMHLNIIGTKVARVELQELTLGGREVAEAIESLAAALELIDLAVAHHNPVRLLGRRRSWRCGSCAYRRRCEADRS